MSDIKKLAKYKHKFAHTTNDPRKQQIYLSKIKEYSSKLKHTGQFGGAGDLDDLQDKFDVLHKKIPTISSAMTKSVNEFEDRINSAKVQHDTLIEKFVEEIKKLHKDKHTALEKLKSDHDGIIVGLTGEVEAKQNRIAELEKELEDLQKKPKDEIDTSQTDRLREEIESLKLQVDTLTTELESMKIHLEALTLKYDAYKKLAEEQIESLGENLDELKSESDEIAKQIKDIKLFNTTDANKRFPQIMYDIAVGEFVAEIQTTNPNATPLPNITDTLRDIVARLKESGKDVTTIQENVKARFTEPTFNALINKYIV